MYEIYQGEHYHFYGITLSDNSIMLVTWHRLQSRTKPLPSNFGCESELKFMFLMNKLTLKTLNDPHDALI